MCLAMSLLFCGKNVWHGRLREFASLVRPDRTELVFWNQRRLTGERVENRRFGSLIFVANTDDGRNRRRERGTSQDKRRRDERRG